MNSALMAPTNSSGVVWLQPIRDLHELFNGSVEAGEWPVFPEFHRACSDLKSVLLTLARLGPPSGLV
jgi:hypothetical protein